LGEGAADVFSPLGFGEQGLRARGLNSAQATGVQGQGQRPGERGSEALGLIEFPFPFLEVVQRHRHNQIPFSIAQRGERGAQKQIHEEGFKPERPGVFVAVDDFENHTPRRDRGPRGNKMQVQVPAVATPERRGEIARKWHAAAFAKGRFDEADLGPTFRADKTFAGRGPLFAAKLADFRIKQRKTGLETTGNRCGNHGRTIGIVAGRAKPEVNSAGGLDPGGLGVKIVAIL